MLTHRNLVANLCQTCGHPAMDFVRPGETTLCVLPMFHIFALNVTMSTSLYNGGRLVTLPPRFDPRLLAAALLTYRPDYLHLVPPLVGVLTSHPAIGPDHLASLRLVFVGAAPVGKSLIAKFHQKAPQVIEPFQTFAVEPLHPCK